MYFKLTHYVKDAFTTRPEDLPVIARDLDDDNAKLKFAVWYGTLPHQPKRRLHCEYTVFKKTPTRVSETLLALCEDRLILDSPIQEGIPWISPMGEYIDIEGNVKPGVVVPVSMLPRCAKPWIQDLKRELSQSLEELVKCVRWTQDSSGGHQPTGFVSFCWSKDGDDWHAVPHDMGVKVSRLKNIRLSPSDLSLALDLHGRKEFEPLGHELVREANQLVRGSPRSALLIAFTALEAGLKSTYIHFVPDAKRLVEEMPSPSVMKLMDDILPQIFKTKAVPQNFFPVTKEEKSTVQKWVSMRNRTAHGASQKIKISELEEFVKFVSVILYRLDYCMGHTWVASLIDRDEPSEE